MLDPKDQHPTGPRQTLLRSVGRALPWLSILVTLGESVVGALAVLRAESSATPAEPTGWTWRRLAHYKCPTSVDIVETLPRAASGKLLKHHLRAPFWAATR